jgi:hypothetical protein
VIKESVAIKEYAAIAGPNYGRTFTREREAAHLRASSVVRDATP